MEAERPQGAKGPPICPPLPNAWNQKGGGGRVSINNSWQWHNGKEREKDGDVMMVDVIYTVCRTWTLAPPRPLWGRKKKKKKKEGELLGEE